MSKNPDDITDFETMKALAHYWLKQSYCMYIKKETLLEVLKEYRIVLDEDDFMIRVAKKSKEETARWEKENQSNKK